MKKNLLLLPLVAFALAACSGNGGSSSSGGIHISSEGTSQSQAEAEGDGLTAETAFTTAQAIAKMKAAGSGVVVDNKEYYVKGTFDAGTTVNATYHQWYGTAGEFKVSGATNDSGVTVAETDGSMDGKSFVVKGYMELFNNEYKVGYLPASASPTGSKYVPSIVKLDGQGGGGTSSAPTSNPSTPISSTPSTGGDGSSIANAMTATDAIAKMKAAGSGVVVDNKEYYVKGTFDAGTTVNATYHQWYGTVGDLKISGATNDSGVTVAETDGSMDGKSFVVKGYLEEYNGEYKIGYLPASASPTGSKYVPSIVQLDGEGGGDTSSAPTSTVPVSGDLWVKYDFSGLTAKNGTGSNGRLSAAELQEAFDTCASASGKVTVTGENIYQGYVPQTDDSSEYKAGVNGALRCGGSSKNGVYNLTVSEAVTGIKITCKAWKDGDLISVNEGSDTALNYGGYTELEFGMAASTKITIKTTYRAFIQSISLLK